MRRSTRWLPIMPPCPALRNAALLLALALLAACRAEPPRVCITPVDGSPRCVTVEIVRTPDARRLGLMYRRQLAADRGMLFVFEGEQPRRFTMRNTLMPLDMLFIDARGRIVGLVERARPQTPGPYGPDVPATYVLEVVGGYCRRHGVRVGDRVSLPGGV